MNIIIEKGVCNAFSFGDISKELGMKNASIHYHFTTKSELIIAAIQKHLQLLEKFTHKVTHKQPVDKIKLFLAVYSVAKSEGKISLLGSLSSAYFTFDPDIQRELDVLTDHTMSWLIETLKERKRRGVFQYTMDDRNKALMIITNILGAEQLSMVTYKHDFQQLKKTIINGLTH